MTNPLGVRLLAAAALAGVLSLFAAGQARAQAVPPAGSDADLAAIIQSAQPEPCGAPDNPCPPDPTGEVMDVVVTGSRVVVDYLATVPANVMTNGLVGGDAVSITNNQVAGVDEGGVVKVSGDILIILRRGRLFTVSMAEGTLRPVDRIDVYPEGAQNLRDAWYDEMLVLDDWVVVIGFNYSDDREGTEINRFRLSSRGELSFVDSHTVRSGDYYSSRNYASRRIGRDLVFYTPIEVYGEADPMSLAPRMSQWRGEGVSPESRPLLTAADVHVAPHLRDAGRPEAIANIHAVFQCDLTAVVFDCRATAVLGPDSRTFYVGRDAVYLWLTEASWRRWRDPQREPDAFPVSSLYRIPLNGGAPTAIQTRGAPVDQFSFHEDTAGGMLNVLVVSDGGGDAMWRPEFARGAAALLRLPLSALGDGAAEAAHDAYTALPDIGESRWSVHNRFVGDHLVYSSSHYDREARTDENWLHVVAVQSGQANSLLMDGDVTRIEALGLDALTVSESDDGATFTTVSLSGTAPVVSDRFLLPDAGEAESRSHAFFFNPDPDSPDGASGVLGLPVITEVDGRDFQRLFWGAADMAYLRREDGRLSLLGLLESRPESARDDGCVASCIDWYGDARPIFVGGRIFALLGYELVEGRIRGGRIREVRRVNFSPPYAPSDPY